MTTLTTASLSVEVLEDALLTLDQLSTSITVLGLNAVRQPDQSPRVRQLLEGLLALVQECETDLGTYAALDA
jgi:hypothetical protein